MSKLPSIEHVALTIIESLPVGIFLVSNSTGRVIFANQKANQVFEYHGDETLGLQIEDMIPEKYRQAHKGYREDYSGNPKPIAMNSGRVLSGLTKNGAEVLIQIGITPLDGQHTILSFIEMTNDIIKPSSSNDPLTGLPNRKLFEERSEGLRELAIRNSNTISIAFIDLNKFKPINDQFGHEFGDTVIVKIANILTGRVRASDVVARVGGDEFIICLYDMRSCDQLHRYLEDLSSEISAIRNIDGHSIDVGASIGATITHFPKNVSINEMVTMADRLMYEAKKSSREGAIINEI